MSPWTLIGGALAMLVLGALLTLAYGRVTTKRERPVGRRRGKR